jgi:exopolysaccharide biosynthesis polyprenyl glycosylphosphotransferase
VKLQNSSNPQVLNVRVTSAIPAGERILLGEDSFHRMISLERKRTERSRKPFLLILLDFGSTLREGSGEKQMASILSALALMTRETDATGWYKDEAILGVMFTELGEEDPNGIKETILSRVSAILSNYLSEQQLARVDVTFYLFPEEWDHDLPQRPSNPTLYPDLSRRDDSRKLFRVLKRSMDVAGSVLAVILFAPLFLAIALAVKLTSEGPVFFRQRRVGQHGKSFVFLKFRSMYINNDPSLHQDYVRELIAGRAERKPSNGNGNGNGNGHGVYKLTVDPRITPVGAFLRKTSLDELPQFLNVLRGEMSLVGPRPAIPYEVEAYDIWHRRRVLEAKPGITGLWQVNGRSKVKFDEMVRLDLRYAQGWSPWLDLKILLKTPRAVFTGDGAW